MAFYCEECHILFPQKKVSCPFCGGRIYSDKRPDAELLRSGYKMAPTRQKTTSEPQKSSADPSSDPYEQLRQAYYAEHPEDDSQGWSGRQQVPTKHSSNDPEPVAEQPPTPEQGGDFFSWDADPVSPPVVEPITAPPPPIPDPPRQSNWPLRRMQLFNRLSAIPGFFVRHWHGFLALLFALLALYVIVYIWSMRFVIMSTISSLFGYVLVIGIMLYGLWSIIRSMFR